MSSLPWFRFYHESLDDAKVQRLPGELFKTWINVLCLASRQDGVLPDVGDIAFALRISEDAAARTVADLRDRGLLEETVSGLMPHNWDGRQPPSQRSDAVAQRKRDQRERARVTGIDESQRRHCDDAVTVTPESPARAEQSRAEQSRTEREQIESRGSAASAAAPPEPPTPLGASPKPKKAPEQPTPEGFSLLTAICELTNAEPRGDLKRREALHADELLRRCGGDATEAVAYVQFRLNRGDSPQLQFAARDYAPGWRKKAAMARASPNGRVLVSTAADFAALADRLEAEGR